MKGMVRFHMKGNLSLCYVGLYEILQRFGNVAYKFRLPSELASVHSVFHVSMLKKCIGDAEFILYIEGLGFQENHSYEDIPVKILDRQVMLLRNKEVSSLKVLWKNQLVKGST